MLTILAIMLSAVPGHVDATRTLFDAMRQVESGGNDRAVGDSGRSVGPYQCGFSAWVEGGGNPKDYPRLAYDRAATETVMRGYWAKYKATTNEMRCRIWNGGPRGMYKKSTLPHWRKVQAAMKGKK